MVVDLSPEEAQEFLKQQEAVSISSGRGVSQSQPLSNHVAFVFPHFACLAQYCLTPASVTGHIAIYGMIYRFTDLLFH